MKPYSLGLALCLVGLLAATAVAQGEDDEKTFLLSKLFKKYKKPTQPACPTLPATPKGLYFILEYDFDVSDRPSYGGRRSGNPGPFVVMCINAPGEGEPFEQQLPVQTRADTAEERCFIGIPGIYTDALQCLNGESSISFAGAAAFVGLQAISFNNPVTSGEYKIGVAYIVEDDYDAESPPPVQYKLTMVKDGVASILTSPQTTLKASDPEIGEPFTEFFENIEGVTPPGVIYTITY